jgi:Protein of unknown function (DUF4199)
VKDFKPRSGSFGQKFERMKKIVITYGIIAGLITGGLMLATMPLFVNGTVDKDNGLWIGYTGMVIALSLVFFGVKSFRDNHAGGKITFGKALLIGLGITLIASLFYVIAWEITFARSGEWFMSNWSTGELDKLKSGGATEAELLVAKKEWDEFGQLYQNPLIRFGMTLMEIFPVGILISLLSAALLRKKEFLPPSSNQ